MSYNRLLSVLNSYEGLSTLSFREIEKWKDFLIKDQWFKKTLKKEEIEKVHLIYNQIISIVENLIELSTIWLKLLKYIRCLFHFQWFNH